jgi:hypothetical protein
MKASYSYRFVEDDENFYSDANYTLWQWDDGNEADIEATVYVVDPQSGSGILFDVQIAGPTFDSVQGVWDNIADIIPNLPPDGYLIAKGGIAPFGDPTRAACVPAMFALAQDQPCCVTQERVAIAIVAQGITNLWDSVKNQFAESVGNAAIAAGIGATVADKGQKLKGGGIGFMIGLGVNILFSLDDAKPIDKDEAARTAGNCQSGQRIDYKCADPYPQ